MFNVFVQQTSRALRTIRFLKCKTLGTPFVLQSIRNGSDQRLIRAIPTSQKQRDAWRIMKMYFFIGFIPTVSLITIVNLNTGNPIFVTYDPEIYEPEFWEHYQHPITRFLAKHFGKDPRIVHYERVYKQENRQYQHKVMMLLKDYERLRKLRDKAHVASHSVWVDTGFKSELQDKELSDYIKEQNLEMEKD